MDTTTGSSLDAKPSLGSNQNQQQPGDLSRATIDKDAEQTGSTTGPSTSATAEPCVICLDTISERAIAVPCNHSAFDFVCIASWVQEQDRCPLCKTQITAIEYNWRGPTDFNTYAVRSRPFAARHQDNEHRSTRGLRPRPAVRSRPTPEPEDESPTVIRRRFVYRNNLYSLHIGDNRLSGFLSFSPQDFVSSPALQRKSRIWIRRELQVFCFLEDSTRPPINSNIPVARGFLNAEFLLEYIVALLRNVDIRGADGKAESLLTEILGISHARLFLHELDSWMRSPFTRLDDWDKLVQYERNLLEPGPIKR